MKNYSLNFGLAEKLKKNATSALLELEGIHNLAKIVYDSLDITFGSTKSHATIKMFQKKAKNEGLHFNEFLLNLGSKYIL